MSQLMHSSAENGSPILLDREGNEHVNVNCEETAQFFKQCIVLMFHAKVA